MEHTRQAISRPFLVALAAALTLPACDAPVAVDGGTGDGSAGLDGSTTDGGGTDGGCAAGEIGCPCDGGACASGQCVAGTCVDCSVATEGCVCRSNGTCNAGLRCASGLCEECPSGENGCACGAGDTCAGGLVCTAGVCVPSTCVEGALGCPCAATDPVCAGDAYCGDTGICERCATDVAGCPCEAGVCAAGFACEAGSCRLARSCADLVTSGACPMGARCDEGVGTDAICFPDECGAGYRHDAIDDECVACASPDCSDEPTCTPGLPHSIDATCLAEHRACQEIAGVGYCTDCLPGYADMGGVCVAGILCGGALCASTEYCDSTSPAGPTCTPWPCPSMTTAIGASGTCSVTCTRPCAVTGSTGRYWPFADAGDSCICETLPGYFFDNGGEIAPVLCDADADGWVRQEVQQILDAAVPDDAIVANARCDVRRVGQVRLVDEYGVGMAISSCDEGLIANRTTEPCTPMPLRLFETRRNDVPGAAALLGEAPPYTAGGRRLRAAELSSLTKACVNTLGDYDDDGVEDVGQRQPTPADTSSLSESARLRSFAHFVELYTTRYEPPVGLAPHGTLVIAERSRCDASFPLGYGADTAYDPADPSTYWRSCERRRDPDFNADGAQPGHDFGRWGCSSRSGSCPAAPMPAHASVSTLPDPSTSLLRGHGLCELGGALPADGTWRGMNHHSQFQCVRVVTDGTESAAYDRGASDFGATGSLVFNDCQVSDCAGAPGCTDSIAPVGVGASSPIIECARTGGVTPGRVGWAALTYQPYGHVTTGGVPIGDTTYNGGCINEDAEYAVLCPAPEFGYCASAPSGAFGRYRCAGWDSLFVWGEDTGTGVRSTVLWADEASGVDPINMSTWNTEPAPSCM